MGINNFIVKGTPDCKPDCIYTKQNLLISSSLKSWCLLLFLTNQVLWDIFGFFSYFSPHIQTRVFSSTLKTFQVDTLFHQRFSSWHLGTQLLPLGQQKLIRLAIFKAQCFSKMIKPSFSGIKFSRFRFFTFLLF